MWVSAWWCVLRAWLGCFAVDMPWKGVSMGNLRGVLWTLLRVFFPRIQAAWLPYLSQLTCCRYRRVSLEWVFFFWDFNIQGLPTSPPAEASRSACASLWLLVDPGPVLMLPGRASGIELLGTSGFSRRLDTFDVGGKRWSEIRCAERVYGHCRCFRTTRLIELP